MILARQGKADEDSHPTLGLAEAWPQFSQDSAENPHARHLAATGATEATAAEARD
jgi:hypothetical protein